MLINRLGVIAQFAIGYYLILVLITRLEGNCSIFLTGYYLILVTKRRKVASVGLHSIYKVRINILCYRHLQGTVDELWVSVK